MPVALRTMLEQFPFRILGFHSDNGSEFLNAAVAKLLGKLLIESRPKSRPRQSNDNALVETKNGAVIRKRISATSHIRRYPSMLSPSSAFKCDEYFNPYLNFPSSLRSTRARSGPKRAHIYAVIYRRYQTPLETTSQPTPAGSVPPSRFHCGHAQNTWPPPAVTPEAARRMQEAKRKSLL